MKTWKDIYELPFSYPEHEDEYSIARVYDNKGQFTFEFRRTSPDTRKKILSIINGEDSLKSNNLIKFEYNKCHQIITTELNGKKIDVIQIRGWGYLTGIGGHYLKNREAINVQDTLGQYIVDRLNRD